MDIPSEEGAGEYAKRGSKPPFYDFLNRKFADATHNKYAPSTVSSPTLSSIGATAEVSESNNILRRKAARKAAILGGGRTAVITGLGYTVVRFAAPGFHDYMFHLIQGVGLCALTGGIIQYS